VSRGSHAVASVGHAHRAILGDVGNRSSVADDRVNDLVRVGEVVVLSGILGGHMARAGHCALNAFHSEPAALKGGLGLKGGDGELTGATVSSHFVLLGLLSCLYLNPT